MWCTLLKQFVETINSGSTPEIISSYEMVLREEQGVIFDNMFDLYEEKMEALIAILPISQELLNSKIEDITIQNLTEFEEKIVKCSIGSINSIESLNKFLADRQEYVDKMKLVKDRIIEKNKLSSDKLCFNLIEEILKSNCFKHKSI